MVGFSFGAIALVILTALIIIIGRKWARKKALREALHACGLTRLLQQAGVGNDEQVLQRAAAWVRENEPASVESIIQLGMVQGFVNSLNLPSIPKQKLLAAFDQGGPQQAMGVAMLVAPEAIPMGTPVAMQRRGSWLGFFGFAATAGASSSSSTQPTLLEMTEILKRELGLKGNMTDVVKQAAEQLNVDVRLPLMEMARQCVQKLGVRQRF